MTASQEELEEFLQTHVQKSLEQAEHLHFLPCPEERPYDNKYLERKILEELLKHPMILSNSDSSLVKPVIAIIHHMLSVNYTETEENSQGEHLLQATIQLFTMMEDESVLMNFYAYLVEAYNNLGFFYVNRDENEKGISILFKAERLYEIISKNPEKFIFAVNNSKEYLLQSKIPVGSTCFRFFYEGGINKPKLEKLHTLTLFYLAQSFTKLNLKEKAASYCAKTMTRQYASKDYEVKDWCVNCISLAEFYWNNHYFAQSHYLLQCGLSVIPEGKKKKLRATFYLSFGRLFFEILKTNITVFKAGTQNHKELQERIDTIKVQFEGLKVEKPVIKVAQNLEDVKSFFRLANTQYKKALEYFVLDGFVTEHIDILSDQSQMYKHLAVADDQNNRVFQMLERRKELLEPLLKQINPKAYQATWQKILVEVAEIYMEMFENRFNEYILLAEDNKPTVKPQKIDIMNSYGKESIKCYQEILKILNDPENKKDDTLEYHQSIVNARFNIAKTYSRFYGIENRIKVENLKKSLENYRAIIDYIKQVKTHHGNLTYSFSEQLKMCTEMVELLPSKIDKINCLMH